MLCRDFPFKPEGAVVVLVRVTQKRPTAERYELSMTNENTCSVSPAFFESDGSILALSKYAIAQHHTHLYHVKLLI